MMNEYTIKRKCIGCNSIKSRCDLIKVTVSKNGEISIMPNTKFFGRSAYICRSKDCLEKAFKKDKLFKILKITRDSELKEKIGTVLES